MVHLAMRRRAGLGKGKKIFTGTSAKLEEDCVPSIMTSPAVTSTPLNGSDISVHLGKLLVEQRSWDLFAENKQTHLLNVCWKALGHKKMNHIVEAMMFQKRDIVLTWTNWRCL